MMTEPLNKFVEASLKRADECLKGAKILLQEGELHGAVSRAYIVALFMQRRLSFILKALRQRLIQVPELFLVNTSSSLGLWAKNLLTS